MWLYARLHPTTQILTTMTIAIFGNAMKENTLFFLGKDATVSFFIITYSNHGKISNVAKADIRKANSKYKNAVIC